MSKHTNNGFTLVEMMIAIGIAAIIAVMAVPSMNSSFDKKRVTKSAETLYANLQLARSESIARFRQVHVRFNTTGSTWQYGVSQNALCDLTQTDPTVGNGNGCLLVVDDGDGTVDDGTATVDAQDTVLYRFTQAETQGVNMTLDTIPANNQITFDPTRGTALGAATITLQSEQGFKMRLIVGVLGQVRLCSPAGAGHVGGYSSDACV